MTQPIDPQVLDTLIRNAATRAAAGVVEALGAALEAALRSEPVKQVIAETMTGWLHHGEPRIGLPPVAAPAAQTPPGEPVNSKMTEARTALFRQLWPNRNISSQAIMDRVNELPGPKYSHPASMNYLAKRLGMSSDRSVYPWTGATGDEAPAQATLPRNRLTPAREQLLRQLWPDLTVPTQDILDRVNALPGPAYTAANTLNGIALKLGLHGKRSLYAPPTAAGQGERSVRNQLTPEREACFRRLWPDLHYSLKAITRELNALPGRPYAERGGSMTWIAKRLGLPTSRSVYATDADGDAAEAVPQAVEPAAQPPATAAPPPEPEPEPEPEAADATQPAPPAAAALPPWHDAARAAFESGEATVLGLSKRHGTSWDAMDKLRAEQGWRKPDVALWRTPESEPAPPLPVVPPAPPPLPDPLALAARTAAAQRAADATAPTTLQAVERWYYEELQRQRKSAAEAEDIVSAMTPGRLLAEANKARDQHGLTRFVIPPHHMRGVRHDSAA